jgi:TolB-like protein/DNA-binding winged helix-turn-helix (wHTH) protein
VSDVTSSPTGPDSPLLRFGVFEVDPRSHELRKKGARVKLQQQPFDLLLVLLERPGETVTREEIRRKLWPADVYVDFDRGLNKAMVKLRDALGDSSDAPLYIETIPRVGYRFIAALQPRAHAAANPHPPATAAPREEIASYFTNTPPPLAASLPGAHPAPTPPLHTDALNANWRPFAALALIVLAIAGISAIWYHEHRASAAAPQIHSIAILPLDNFSGDPKQDYFSDGVTDELTTMLAENSNLRVTSRTSTMQYKGQHKPLREIARELGVDAIVEGSVARKGDAVHLNLQVIDTSNDAHLWAHDYDRTFADVMNLSDDAAKAIAARLNSSASRPTSTKYVNPEAHDAYLRGLNAWYSGKNDESAVYFKKAMEIQPDYALSWVGQSFIWGAAVDSQRVAPLVGLPKMKEAAVKAVQLDDESPEAHLALGSAYYYADWDFNGANHELERAIELNPTYSEALHLRSYVLIALHRYDEAVDSQRRATEIDPFSRPHVLARIYSQVRRYQDAERDANWRLVSMPNDWGLHLELSYVYRCTGRYKEWLDETVYVWKRWDFAKGAEGLQKAFERGGYQAALRYRLDLIKERPASIYTSPYSTATVTAELGDSEREHTLNLLEDAVRKHDIELLAIQTDPVFDHLHSDPRYRAVIHAIGLTPSY